MVPAVELEAVHEDGDALRGVVRFDDLVVEVQAGGAGAARIADDLRAPVRRVHVDLQLRRAGDIHSLGEGDRHGDRLAQGVDVVASGIRRDLHAGHRWGGGGVRRTASGVGHGEGREDDEEKRRDPPQGRNKRVWAAVTHSFSPRARSTARARRSWRCGVRIARMRWCSPRIQVFALRWAKQLAPVTRRGLRSFGTQKYMSIRCHEIRLLCIFMTLRAVSIAGYECFEVNTG